MSDPQIKGWCPGALRPMMSGDGLVVRIKPFGGRLRRAQADGIASLAAAHGNGLLDLSSRANIQIRGVTPDRHEALIEGLGHMGLVDATADIESRRNIMVMPFWQPGDDTELLAGALAEAVAADDAPDLPGKFGFAIDTGRMPVLQNGSADIRLETDAGGGLILVADGATVGKPVTLETATTEALALARWFADRRGPHTRMARLLAADPARPGGHFVPRQIQEYVPKPGHTPNGSLVGLAFGAMQTETLSTLAKHGGLRLTPWRLLLVESARALPDIADVITDPDDPLLRITACTGPPRCAQGLAPTRALGRTLAPHLGPEQSLHISGCTKGCAHPRPAPLTLTATPDGYDLIENGTAADAPVRTGLTPDDLKDLI
ncbi:precorrin-3B synthase [Sulfitobacter sp. S190]|uniref:precorrin-3B synthase n=1 Tax=Sulfitobacter sp. S190 TaxID=2867022 RepID=UPI0021A36FEC|nr:precorrin-3B synthase [Sulfitobacter sp. S190]UWR22335.1 precorrin-3B synthase [Sulfitobacter sp. S190]